MIIVGVAQLIAGVLLTLSGGFLWQAEVYPLAVVDLIAGATLMWFGIDRFDPPSGGNPELVKG